MTGKLKKYAFINAKMRARISKITPDEVFERLIRVPSLQEAIGYLADTSFGFISTVYNKTGDLKMVELDLFAREVQLYLELEKYLVDEVNTLVLGLVIFYEVENLKRTVRLWFDRAIRGRYIGDVVGYLYRDRIRCNIPIDSILNAETFSEVTAAVSQTPYFDIFRAASDKIESLRSVFPIEVGLDRYFYSQLLTEVDRFKGRDREVAYRMIGVEIDMQNLNWIIRFKNTFGLNPDDAIGYLIPRGLRLHNDIMRDAYTAGNDTEMLSMLQGTGYLDTVLTPGSSDASSRLLMMESLLAQIVMQEAKRILVGNPFTVGTLLAYFLLKKTEIRNIMTLLNGKNYNLSEERIRSALLF